MRLLVVYSCPSPIHICVAEVQKFLCFSTFSSYFSLCSNFLPRLCKYDTACLRFLSPPSLFSDRGRYGYTEHGDLESGRDSERGTTAFACPPSSWFYTHFSLVANVRGAPEPESSNSQAANQPPHSTVLVCKPASLKIGQAR